MASDEDYMQLCIELAQRGIGHVAPNPMVGCVLVCQNKIVGQGWHQKFGEAHAEINAISSVKNPDLLPQCTLYVNLEPCAHYGKTPPCAKKIIDLKIPRVVIGNIDPFPKVNGGGIAMLKAAGIDVKTGVLAEKCSHFNKRFFTFHTKKRPYITLKWAQSADGFLDKKRTANETRPVMISSDETLREMHCVRAEETAVLVGTNTAIMDNPSLTVRLCKGTNPVRVLIDKTLRVPQSAKLFDGSERTIVFTEKSSVSSERICYKKINFQENIIPQILDKLYRENLLSLLVEGGAKTLNAFLHSGFYDEVRIETNESLFLHEGTKSPDFNGGIRISEERFGKNIIRKYIKET